MSGARETRPRRARPSYTELFQGTEDEALDQGSGSDFAPENEGNAAPEASDEDVAESQDDVEEIEGGFSQDDDDDDDEHPIEFDTWVPQSASGSKTIPKTPRTKRVNASKPRKSVSVKAGTLNPPFQSPSKKRHVLPRSTSTLTPTLLTLPFQTTRKPVVSFPGLPSANHRHRTFPLCIPPIKPRRLAKKPKLFEPEETVPTVPVGGKGQPAAERFRKAWAAVAGKGPHWEMVEDLSWWKECFLVTPEGGDIVRRPRVYAPVPVSVGWEIMNYEAAKPYIPTAPPVVCSFGPAGEQTKVQMNPFDTKHLGDFFSEERHSWVFNAGGPVWGIDWCPRAEGDPSLTKYLAISPLPSTSYKPTLNIRQTRPSYATIQIWAMAAQDSGSTQKAKGKGKQSKRVMSSGSAARICCESVLCIDCGPCMVLKWCPLPSADEFKPAARGSPRKLGILAAIGGDGAISLYCVPHPEDLGKRPADGHPRYVKLPKPTLRLEIEDTTFTCMDWANSEQICAGCSNGSIVVYYIKDALEEPPTLPIFPTHYIVAHQAAIRDISWIRVPPVSSGFSSAYPAGHFDLQGDPTLIGSAGFDGQVVITDIREGVPNTVIRCRELINTISFATFAGVLVCLEQESGVKYWAMMPESFGKGHGMFDPAGPIWSISTSDYHPIMAAGCADGSCMTSNLYRSTRRGSVAPHFVHKIYQMDYGIQSGEYRMLDNLFPFEAVDLRGGKPTVNSKQSSSPSKEPSSKKARPVTSVPDKRALNLPWSGSWPAEVGVHRVAWFNGGGMNDSGLLASAAGAGGLVRIDWLEGRWARGRVPYGGVEFVRMEKEGGTELGDADGDGEDVEEVDEAVGGENDGGGKESDADGEEDKDSD